MTKSHQTLARELVGTLGSAASYNDKGFFWTRHTEEQQDAFRAQLQQTLVALAEQIGEGTLGPDLYEALTSGAAVRDGSGTFVALARERLRGGAEDLFG